MTTPIRRNQSERIRSSNPLAQVDAVQNLNMLNTIIIQHKRELKSKLKSHFDFNTISICPKFTSEKREINLNPLRKFKDFNYIILKLKKSPKFMSMLKKAPSVPTTLSKQEVQTLHHFLSTCSSKEIDMVF